MEAKRKTSGSVLARLAANKGTVSSALGKVLAEEILVGGDIDLLMDCIDLVSYETSRPGERNIRAGAAKVVEIVAQKSPQLVAPYLGDLLPALSAPEPQTRWMVFRAMGFCAHLNAQVARQAIPFAERCLDDKEGLCIASSADLLLGDLGALSADDAGVVFPLLKKSMSHPLLNEEDWLLEALAATFGNLAQGDQGHARSFAAGWVDSPRKTTRKRAEHLLGLAG